MRKNKFILSFLSLGFASFFLFTACEEPLTTSNKLIYPPDNEYKVTITQGVWGNVWFWKGDFMPFIDPNRAKIYPVIRKIYVYEATNDSMVERASFTFFRKINSELITTVSSGIDGFYEVSLPPGKYSFFVKEDSLFYANGWDGEGDILSATVTENNTTKRQIDITYAAVY